MSKPKLLGSNRNYLPNNRADQRRRKVWERNLRVAERDVQAIREGKAEKEKLAKYFRQMEAVT